MLKSKRTGLFRAGLFAFIFSCLVILSLLRHGNGYFNWLSELWADKAGYYMFLPATFNYQFKAGQFPQDIDHKTGDGFTLDHETNKIKTRYTYGVALLCAPFYLAIHGWALLNGLDHSGFSPLYHKFMNIPVLFYVTLGFFLLFGLLKKKTGKGAALITCFIVFTGTNLLYYTLDETMMSHGFSFFLFTLLLFSLDKIAETDFKKDSWFFVFCLASALITIVRPVNLLFVILTVVFYAGCSAGESWQRLLKWLYWKRLAVIILVLALVWLPQFAYWHYLSGEFLMYSYEKEKFVYWLEPKILNILIAPYNGLLLYSPVYLLIMISVVGVLFFKIPGKWYTLILFTAALLLFASWQSWGFGCSYGCRPFVDLLPSLSIPLAIGINEWLKRKGWLPLSLWGLMVVYFIFFNVRLSYSWPDCFFGAGWEWKEYQNGLERAGVIPFQSHRYVFSTDFDQMDSEQNRYFENQWMKICTDVKAGDYMAIIQKDNLKTITFSRQLRSIGTLPVKSLEAFYSLNSRGREQEITVAAAILDYESRQVFRAERKVLLKKGDFDKKDALIIDLPVWVPQDFEFRLTWTSNTAVAGLEDLYLTFRY